MEISMNNMFVKAIRESRSKKEELAIFQALFRFGDLYDVSEVARFIASISISKKRVVDALNIIESMSDAMSPDDRAAVLYSAMCHAYHQQSSEAFIIDKYGLS